MIGRSISQYKIVEELGRGGMGVVYKAEDTKLKRTVALKFLSPHLLTDERQRARFLHEAQAAAALDHPNISTIYEVHEAEGHAFMVLAYLEGEDVASKIELGPLALEDALDIAIQVGRGLAKAHSVGIVHRDIKPGNVIITPEGQAKILDFGLAKLADQTRLTKTGTSVGTVRYMSPEQASGGEVDHRTDIWSFGVMLFEMLTGETPFRGEIEQAMIYSILNEDPPPVTSKRRDVPIGLGDIIEKALAKDPAKRYANMDELLKELETQRDQLALGIKERRFTAMRKLRRRKRLIAVIAAVAVISAVALKILFQDPGTGIDSIAVLPFSNLSRDEEQEYFSDGMTESLIDEIGRIGALRVISRTSVMQFKKTDKPLQEIARVLNVDAVVEASVLRAGDRIQIRARLIRTEPEELLWSDSYDRDGKDVTIVLSEVARAIANRIQITVVQQVEDRLTRARNVDPEAHDAYLKGLHFALNWGHEKALRYLTEAIRIDPTFAEAYAGLAHCYNELGLFGHLAPKDAYPKARAAAKKALQLDDSQGRAKAALAYVKFVYDRDWYAPDADYRRAVELSPNDPQILMSYDQYLTTVGRYQEAIRICKRAIELDPLTPENTLHLAWIYYYAGMYDESIETANEVVDVAPALYVYATVADSYFKKGMYSEAVACYDSALALSEGPGDQVLYAYAAYVFGRIGHEDKAIQILNQLLALSEREHVAPLHIALVYSGLGQTDEMFEWLEKCYAEGGGIDIPMDFSEYGDDPRYIDLCRRIGIPLDE